MLSPTPLATKARPAVENDDDEDFEPRQTLREIRAAVDQDARDGLITGFETLEMPFVSGPVPQKAKKMVLFEIPNSGTMSARYHAVVNGDDCIALIYDTRYEDGNQYLPPDLGVRKILVTLPRKNQADMKFVCSSMGVHFNIGVLDIVVLIKHKDEDVDTYVGEDDED